MCVCIYIHHTHKQNTHTYVSMYQMLAFITIYTHKYINYGHTYCGARPGGVTPLFG